MCQTLVEHKIDLTFEQTNLQTLANHYYRIFIITPCLFGLAIFSLLVVGLYCFPYVFLLQKQNSAVIIFIQKWICATFLCKIFPPKIKYWCHHYNYYILYFLVSLPFMACIIHFDWFLTFKIILFKVYENYKFHSIYFLTHL